MDLTPQQRFGIAACLSMPSQMRATVEGRLDQNGNLMKDAANPAGSKAGGYTRLVDYLSGQHGIAAADVDRYKPGILDFFGDTGLIKTNQFSVPDAMSAYYAPGKPCPGLAVERQLMQLNLNA